MGRSRIRTEVPDRPPVMAPEGGVRFEDPRKAPTGESNAQLLQKFYKERELPEKWFDPDSNRFFTGAPTAADNDQIRKMMEVMLGGDETAKRAIIQAFNSLEGSQQKYWLARIAAELPNPRSDQGFSPQAQELVDFLQGKPGAVSVRRRGQAKDYGPNKGLRENIEIVPDRAETIEKVRQAGDVPPSVKTTEKNLGEAAQEFAYDDSPVVDTTAPGSPVLGEAPGDILTQPGLPPRTTPSSILKKLPAGHPIKDDLEYRPFLRSGKEGEFAIVQGENGEIIPKFLRGKDSSSRIGPQDYKPWVLGKEFEAGASEYENAVRNAVAERFGSPEQFVDRLNAARAAKDKQEVNALMAEVQEVIKSVADSHRLPPKPYPMSGKKGDFLAAQSNRSERDVFTDAIRQAATAKSMPQRMEAVERAWKYIQKKGKEGDEFERGTERTLTPADPASGLTNVKDANGDQVPPPEVLADLFLAHHSPDPASSRPEYRRAIVEAIESRFFSPTRQAEPDPNAVVVTDTGDTAKLSEQRKRLGRDPDPDTMDAAQLSKFKKATKDVGVPKGEEEYEPLTGKPVAMGIPTATSPEQLAAMQAKDLEDWKLGRLGYGKVVYKDGDKWKAVYITEKTRPGKMDDILAKAKASASELGEEGQGELEKLIKPWDTVSEPLRKEPTAVDPTVKEINADEWDNNQLEMARNDWLKLTGKMPEVPPGFIKRPDGKIVRSAYLTKDEMAEVNDDWAKSGGVNWGKSDVPFPGDNPPKKLQDQFEVDDPGPGRGYDGPEFSGPPAAAGKDDILQEIIDIIDDPNSTADDLDWARSQRDEARLKHDAETDEEVRAEFKRSVLDPINAAAARRQARAGQAAQTSDVDEALEAAATPIEPEGSSAAASHAPKPAPVDPAPSTPAQRVPAKTEKAPEQIRAGDSEGLDGVDVDESLDGVTPNGTLIKRDAKPKDPRWFPRTRDHLWSNKGKYATGAAISGIGLYAATPGNPPYIPGSEPFSFGAEGPEQAIAPEDRIRQAIKLRMEQELIPHTSQRYY